MARPITGIYQVPATGTLMVAIEHADGIREATEADLALMGYVPRGAAYQHARDFITAALEEAGDLLPDDFTDAQLNPLRYLFELAATNPELLNHVDVGDDLAMDIRAIERALCCLAVRDGDGAVTVYQARLNQAAE